MTNTTILICVALGLAVVGVTWWLYGLGPLVVLFAVLVLVCPAVDIWIMRQQRRLDRRRDAAKR